MSERYSVVDIDDVETAGPDGPRAVPASGGRRDGVRVQLVRARSRLEGPEHDETASKQEEVMIVVSGNGTLEVDGEELALSAGASCGSTRRPCDRCTRATPGSRSSPSVARAEPYVARGPF